MKPSPAFSVTPFLGLVRADFDPVAEAGEVEEVFTVPLSHRADTRRDYRDRGAAAGAGELRRFYAVPYGPYYIWGATARILRGLAERVAA